MKWIIAALAAGGILLTGACSSTDSASPKTPDEQFLSEIKSEGIDGHYSDDRAIAIAKTLCGTSGTEPATDHFAKSLQRNDDWNNGHRGKEQVFAEATYRNYCPEWAPAAKPVSTKSTEGAQTIEDAAFLAKVNTFDLSMESSKVNNRSIIGVAQSICSALDQGTPIDALIESMLSMDQSVFSNSDLARITGAAVGAYCPTHAELLN